MFSLFIGVAVAGGFGEPGEFGPTIWSFASAAQAPQPAVGAKEPLDGDQIEALAKIIVDFGEVQGRWKELAFYLTDAKKTDITKNAIGSYILKQISDMGDELGTALASMKDPKHRITEALGDAAGEFVEYPPQFEKAITKLISNSKATADGVSLICFPSSPTCKTALAELGDELELIGKDITAAFKAADSGADKYDIVDVAGSFGGLASGIGAGLLKMASGLGETPVATAYETIAAGGTDVVAAYQKAIDSLMVVWPPMDATPTMQGNPTHQTLGAPPTHHGIGARGFDPMRSYSGTRAARGGDDQYMAFNNWRAARGGDVDYMAFNNWRAARGGDLRYPEARAFCPTRCRTGSNANRFTFTGDCFGCGRR